MKFLAAGKKSNEIEDLEYDILIGIAIEHKSLHKDAWGSAIIFEADEAFELFAMIKLGWAPIQITELEFSRILQDGVVFLSKERAKSIRTAYYTMFPRR